MTKPQSDFIKKNVINFATIITLVGFIISQSRWQENVDNRLNSLELHTKNVNMHMPFERKIEVFVPRVELDGRLQSIQNSLIRIEKKIE
jgi:hypothetical protein